MSEAHAITMPARAPRTLGPIERARLWVSYQRYAFLMAGVPLAATLAVAVRWPGAWWAWAPMVALTLKLWAFAATIWQRWPYKRVATLRFQRQIDAGRFTPDSLRSFCDDPCFRVVAREVARRAGIRGAAQRALLRRLTAEQADRGRQLILVDRAQGVVFQVDGRGVQRRSLATPPTTPEMEGIPNGR